MLSVIKGRMPVDDQGGSVDERELHEKVSEAAEGLEVPGVAVGVYRDGMEHYAFHGVTSIENPLPVDDVTLFQFGSTGKTFTATAVMRLVEEGKVDLDAPVRTYIPELKLKDDDVAQRVTVLQLLNHTAGWAGDLMEDVGDGDDALDKYLAKMADLEQVSPLGSGVSYNNASLSVAGLIISRVTGKVYEKAMKELLFEPLGLEHTFFFMNEIMTRRFAVGHNQHPDGHITVARPWSLPRGNYPAGGMSANAGDQVAWARFHLTGGLADDGTRLLSEELVRRMQQPTVESPGSAVGDAIGISWLINYADGVPLVGHGGTTNGQLSSFVMVPDRDFAVTVLTNCAPNGSQLHHDLERWALENYVGLVVRDPEPVDLSAAELAAYTGRFETIAATCDITVDGTGLLVKVEPKPEMLAVLREAGEENPEDQPPLPLGLLPGDGDRYIVTDGPAKGMKGYFVRGIDGSVEAVHMGGRIATRTGATAEPVPA
jgi:CubicO group peptidase (beta-lactamase class C family)